MNLAKVSSNGQITVPIEMRRKLALKEGDKIMFFEKNGEIVLKNSSIIALREAQSELEGINISEEEILNDVMNLRYGDNK